MAGIRNDLQAITLYVKIYNHFYSKLAEEAKYHISNDYKVKIVDTILRDLSWSETNAIRAMVRYNLNYMVAHKNTKIDKKDLYKQFELGTKHMYSPKHIGMAVRGYYTVKNPSTKAQLSPDDFGGKKYIVTALTKQGILYKEQLLKHLSNGYYYLWTITGCGDNARQEILKAVDKWEGRR